MWREGEKQGKENQRDIKMKSNVRRQLKGRKAY